MASSVAKGMDSYLRPALDLPPNPGLDSSEVEEIYDTMNAGEYNDVQEIYDNSTPQDDYVDVDTGDRDYQNVGSGGKTGYHPAVPANDELYI